MELSMSLNKVVEYLVASKPRTHSYGFAQVYLNDDVRLHLFSDEIAAVGSIPDQVPVRHNHRYDFVSAVLRGIVVDRPAHWVPFHGHSDLADIEPWTMHEVQPSSEGQVGVRAVYEGARDADHGSVWDAGRVQPVEKGWVVEGKPRICEAGGSYFMHHNQFHESGWIGETLTLFQRVNVRHEWSKLLVPPGYKPTHPLTKQPDVGFLRQRFIDAVVMLPEDRIDMIAEHIA
jgi:hypothetical protein